MSMEKAKDVLRHLIQNPDLLAKFKDCTPAYFKAAAEELKDSGELDKDSDLHDFIKDTTPVC